MEADFRRPWLYPGRLCRDCPAYGELVNRASHDVGICFQPSRRPLLVFGGVTCRVHAARKSKPGGG